MLEIEKSLFLLSSRNPKKDPSPHSKIVTSRKSGQPVRLPSREEIIRKAEEGIFDHNTLLALPHKVICRDCGYDNNVTFLEYLKSGKFEIGETKTVEVTYAAPTSTGLDRTTEESTPLVFRIECRKCGTVTPHSPVSLEYLLFAATRKGKSDMYI